MNKDDHEHIIRQWVFDNPGADEQTVKSFPMFSTKPVVRLKLEIEPPQFCCECGRKMPLFSFRFNLSGNQNNLLASMFAPLNGIDLVPIRRICDVCDRLATQRLEEMRKASLPAPKKRRKNF